MQASIFGKWEGCAGRASGVKMGYDGGGSLISLDGVVDGIVASRMVAVSASVIFPCTIIIIIIIII